ncbi:MAG TPA: ABC transporter ATP-binding protein [Mycobacteriales bacterium]|nr:ABC transporter ATP-binding protein [Mycobacteriales bacterium]
MNTGPRASGRAGWLLLRLAFRTGVARAMLVLVLAAVAGAATAAIGLGLKLLVDGAAAGSASRMLTAVGVLVGLVTVNGLIVVGTTQVRFTIEQRVELLVDQDILRTCASLPGLEHVEDPAVLDRMDLLRGDRPMIASAWGAIVENLRAIVRLVVIIVLLVSVNPWLLFLCVLAVPSLWASTAGERRSRRAEEATAESERLARSLFTLVTNAATAKEARVYGTNGLLADRHQTVLSGLWRVRQRADTWSYVVRYGAQVLFVLGSLGAGALALVDAAAGRASAGDVALVMTLSGQLDGAVGGAVRLSDWLRRALRGASRYVWLTDYAAAATVPARPDAEPHPGRPGELVLDRVSFSYPGASTPTLRNVSVRVPVGATVAIVGDNGAGKTTLVKLLCGFYRPSAGWIVMDGVDLSRVPVEEWRLRLSACFQDFARFEFPLQETVGVGHLPQVADAAAVTAALARADALDIPAGLADGLSTQLGRTFDGAELSGGQWQKTALARASMRTAPELLILDEPTASLDPATESALIDGYTRAASGPVTTVLVSHRLNAVGMADLIVVLDRGEVVETGTHDALIAAGGRYADLYELQARRYR